MLMNQQTALEAYISGNLGRIERGGAAQRSCIHGFCITEGIVYPDIKRLGYESMAVVTADGYGHDVADETITDLRDREYIKRLCRAKAAFPMY
jgi:hypothetical protein